METFSGRGASQDPDELASFVSLLQERGVCRYLEIGARHGDTFHHVMSALPVGSLGVAVDLPNADWGHPNSHIPLIRAHKDLESRGYEVHKVIGDSQSEETCAAVRAISAEFDAILIDGDHSYSGVQRDFELYGSLAPLVAFHDIVGYGQRDRRSGQLVEVPEFWRDICDSHEALTFISEGSKMGIGVILCA